MGTIGRQSIKSTFYVYLGVILGFITRAHLFPKYLSEAEIGVIVLLISYASIFAQIAILGFNHATIRYFPYFRNKSKGHHGFISLYALVVLVGFLIAMVAFYLVQAKYISTSDAIILDQYYYLVIPLTAGVLIFNVMDNYNNVLYNATTGILLREFGLRLLILLFFILLIKQWVDFEGFARLYSLTYLMIALGLIGFVIWRGDCYLRFDFNKIDRTLLKSMAGISFFGFLTGLSTTVIQHVNNIMIDAFYDEALTGIYATNFLFATLILLPSRGLNKIAPTMISDAFKEKNFKTINSIQFKSTINQQLISTLLWIGLLINLENIYEILPESFAVGKWVIVLVGLGNVIQMTGGVSSAIIGFSSIYRYNTYVTVLQLILLVILNWVFLPIWGISGAAFATLVTILLLNLLKFRILHSNFNIQPYGKKHLLVVVVGLICFAIGYLIPRMTGLITDILVRSCLVTIGFVGISYFLKISRQLNDAINNTLGRLRIQ